MSNQELQELLIKKIRQTDDNGLLEEARQQIKNGESFTHTEANQLINEWLEKLKL